MPSLSMSSGWWKTASLGRFAGGAGLSGSLFLLSCKSLSIVDNSPEFFMILISFSTPEAIPSREGDLEFESEVRGEDISL